MSIAEIAADTLTFAGVGNVDGLLVLEDGRHRLMPDRGMLGAVLPRPKPQALALTVPWALIMHSDGVSQSTFSRLESLDTILDDADAFARQAVELGGRGSDDATVLVIHS